jgi:cell division protein FtsI/penicillin-binding protein 2
MQASSLLCSYPHGESTAFVQQLKYALERSSDRDEPVVTLTLDVPLNRQLTERLEQRERVRRRTKRSNFKSLREAVTVMDTFTGEVLAMAAWPTFNPNQTTSLDALSDSLRDENQARYRMARKNLNLMSHVMGSSQKPFTALAALHVRPEILLRDEPQISTGNKHVRFNKR